MMRVPSEADTIFHFVSFSHAGFNSFLAVCATSPPVNVFAQNNGIIAFTLCASRMAGVACAFWLFIFGVLAKV